MQKLLLITGGARSGKSSYALERCEGLGGKRCFIATCPVIDPEMDGRIAAHKIEREGRGWECREEEIALIDTLPTLNDFDVVLIDCLTLWVNNLMYRAEQENTIFDEDEIQVEVEKLATAIEAFSGTICLVTNEVGSGVVPENKVARKYRDLVGRCNRYLAKKAHEVILVSCGIPLTLKS